jgi:hypothetical protein
MMSTQVNFHLQLSAPASINMTAELEADLRNALRKAVFTVLEAVGEDDCILTIRGPEVVSLF